MSDTEPTVETVMSRKIYTVSEQDPLRDAYELMMDQGIRALPVLGSNDSPVGMICDRDILCYRMQNILPRHADYYINVSEVMTSEVRTLSPETVLKKACDKLTESGYLQIPVLNENQEVVGLFGYDDLLCFFLENGENIFEMN